jgi:hypothetical protein
MTEVAIVLTRTRSRLNALLASTRSDLASKDRNEIVDAIAQVEALLLSRRASAEDAERLAERTTNLVASVESSMTVEMI